MKFGIRKGGKRIIGLFSIKKKQKSALAFVDFEHWYVSMYRKFSMKPRLKEWRDSLAGEYDLKEILFFGDFSNPGMKYEIPRIRAISNLIIETQNTSPHHKKDFTDFIMLDYIYQKAISSPDVDTFIIFTGDGHFSSVVKFLRDRCKKHVIIYAVKDSLSGMLRSVATETYELPTDEDISITHYSMIAAKITEATLPDPETGKRKYALFPNVAGAVASAYNMDVENVRGIMNEMAEKGYIRSEYKYVRYNRRLKTITLDNDALKKDGISLITDSDYFVLPKNAEKKRQKGRS